MTWWLMFVQGSRWRYLPAEAPCWKGELQCWRFVMGWQRNIGGA